MIAVRKLVRAVKLRYHYVVRVLLWFTGCGLIFSLVFGTLTWLVLNGQSWLQCCVWLWLLYVLVLAVRIASESFNAWWDE